METLSQGDSSMRALHINCNYIGTTLQQLMLENLDAIGAENYDEYLTHLYGDWRKLPPEEKRVTHHDYIKLDLEKSYLKDL